MLLGTDRKPWRSTERDPTCSTMILKGMWKFPFPCAHGERAVNYQKSRELDEGADNGITERI